MRMIVTIAPVLLLAGCYYDKEELLYPASFCDLTDVSYSATIGPLVQNSCATPGCHVAGGTGTGNFTSYAGVNAAVANGTLRSQVLVDRTMPPTGPLSDCDMQQIALWLDAGALNN